MTAPPGAGSPGGVGLGLRWDFVEELVDRVEAGRGPALPFLEIHPENYIGRGGYVREAVEYLADHYPIFTHGLSMSIGGTDPLDPGYLAALRRLLERLGARWHSEHLCFSGVDGRQTHELLPLPRTAASAANAAARARAVSAALGLPLALENVSAYLELGESELDEPDYLSLVLRDSGCDLLLDVNNVFVNAQNFGFDPREWLERVDLARVVAIHVAGHHVRASEGLVIDTHAAAVAPSVHELLAYAVARVGHVPVILERDAELPTLDLLLEEVAALQATYDRALALASPGAPTRRPPTQPSPVVVDAQDQARLTAVERFLQATVGGGGPSGHRPAALLAVKEVAEVDRQALASRDPRRLAIYGTLAREQITDACLELVPRAARLRAGQLGVERYLESELPRSRFMREVPFEVAAWASSEAAGEARWPAVVADLARAELCAFAAGAAPRLAPNSDDAELAPDLGVSFCSTLRLGAFRHDVTSGLDDEDGPRELAAGSVWLGFHRDAGNAVRRFELDELTAVVCLRLSCLREPLGLAVATACQGLGVSLDAERIDTIARCLASLAERGVVLGAGPTPSRQEPECGTDWRPWLWSGQADDRPWLRRDGWMSSMGRMSGP